MKYKKYNLIILAPLGLLIIAILFTANVLQPINGVLTRLGGYSENEFGWNLPQERFKSRMYVSGKYGLYDKNYDVVVLGDSFTNHMRDEVMHPAGYWPNYFVNATGLDLIAYNSRDTNIRKLIESDGFKKFPPRLFIFQIVERDLIWSFSGVKSDCIAGKNPDNDPNMFTIEGSKNLENSYYNWLQQPQNKSEYLRPNVSGGQTYESWIKSTQGNIDMNHQEDMEKNKVTHQSLLEKWG